MLCGGAPNKWGKWNKEWFARFAKTRLLRGLQTEAPLPQLVEKRRRHDTRFWAVSPIFLVEDVADAHLDLPYVGEVAVVLSGRAEQIAAEGGHAELRHAVGS